MGTVLSVARCREEHPRLSFRSHIGPCPYYCTLERGHLGQHETRHSVTEGNPQGVKVRWG